MASAHRIWRTAAGLTLALACAGCVAAAIPVMAGGMVLKRGGSERSAAARPEEVSGVPVADVASVTLTDLTALPPPTPGSSGQANNAYAALAEFALATAGREGMRSVIVDPLALTSGGAMRSCPAQDPAVLIDLDPGVVSFDPSDAVTTQPGLAEALAKLRAAGVVILWQSALDVGQSAAVYRALAATGLDPAGIDRLLLLSDQEQSKQDRRQAAARYNCIIAIAGDRRGDFDELYDYLKDPAQPLPIDATIGNGWFLVPPPLANTAD